LFGDLHGAQFGADTCGHSSADDQPGDDGTALLDDGNDEERGEERLGAEADKAVTVFERKNDARGRTRQRHERKRFRAQLVQLVGEFPGFIRRKEDGSDQLEAEEAQISKPLEEADQEGSRRGLAGFPRAPEIRC